MFSTYKKVQKLNKTKGTTDYFHQLSIYFKYRYVTAKLNCHVEKWYIPYIRFELFSYVNFQL